MAVTGQHSRLHALRSLLSRRLVSPLQGITFREWCRVLTGHHGGIDPEYLPRTAATGLSAVINSVHARLEERRFGIRVRKTEVHSPIFVLGHYRSGTTHLHNLLSVDSRFSFPNYYQVSFPRTFLTTEAVGVRVGNLFALDKRPHDNVAVTLEVPAEDELALCADTLMSPHMCWHFPARATRYRRYLTLEDASPRERERWKSSLRRLAQKLSLKYGRRPLVFKSPCHTARIPLILEAFPDARFIHIHRDPFEIFQSTRNMETKVGPLFQYQRRESNDLDEYILWRYRTMYDAFLGHRERIPEGRFTEVSYAGLVDDPIETLRHGYRSLDLPDFEEVRPAVERYLDKVNGYRTNVYDRLDSVTRQRVAREWQRFFDEWNYPRGNGAHGSC